MSPQTRKKERKPFKVYTIDENENNKKIKPTNVRSRLLSWNKKKITKINVNTLKLLIKMFFFDK